MDGRRPPELRKLSCQLGKCQQADGSAVFEQGNTKAIATVYGPHDVSYKQLFGLSAIDILVLAGHPVD